MSEFKHRAGEGIANGYDAFGRLLSSTSNMDGVSRSVSRSRDDVNNRTNVTYGGQTYVYDYDDASRLDGVYQGNTVTATALLTGFTYTPRGQVALRNGKVSSVNHGYDAIGRLTSMAHAFAGGAGNGTFGLPLYNPASQIERRTRSNDAYAWNGGVEVNRPYTVNALNQYTSAGTTGFGYDRNGNLTSSGSTTYVYDVENRLVSASGSRTANLRYDPLGRLYEIGAATPARRLLWDGDALVAEYQITGALAARFVHGPGEGVDDPLIWFGGGENRRLHTDHQGSVVAITNGAGAQTWLNAYDEWGIPNMTAGAPANTGRFQYTGQIWIGELGMYHYKARIYSPTLGRFLQTDPVGYDDQVNLYAYVGNDPVNAVDPTGQTIRLVGTRQERERLRADILAVARSDPRLAARYVSLVRSNNVHLVRLMPVGNRSAISEVIPIFAENGRGTSTRVFIETGDNALADATANNTRARLAHELFSHSYDADRGTRDTDMDPATGVPDSEVRATQIENIYRQASGMDERSHYGGRPVPAASFSRVRRSGGSALIGGTGSTCDGRRAGSCGSGLE